MFITDIHIYGYGKLTDFKITGLHELQVIYGENEAGKSTIMSFIHSVLFGFPTKQQSELRYEPKEGAKYGGRLTAIFPGRGKAVIERVKGKAAGDVSVLLEDGTTGEDELLKELLSNVDKSLFQSIFSFNIHGLQNVNQIKSEDLGRYLFSAGALGTDQLLSAENTLHKELESRFKPNGKKPYINGKLKELKQLHSDLKKAEQQNDQYWNLLQEKDALEKSINENQNEQILTEKCLSRLKEWKELSPLITKEKALSEEAEQYKRIQFPVDGISRLDRLEEMQKPLESRIAGVTARIKSLRTELEVSIPNDQLLNNEPEIIAAIESLPLYEKLKQEENEMSINLLGIGQEESALREKLHLPIEDGSLLTIDTSVFMKEKVMTAQEYQRRLKVKKLDLDERFNEEKQALEEIEEKIRNLETQLLPETERAALEEKIKGADQRQMIERELKETQDRLNFLHNAQKIENEKASKMNTQNRTQVLLFSLLFTGLFAWGIWSSNWILAGAGFIGVAFSVYTFFNKTQSSSDDLIQAEIEALAKRESNLEQKLNQPDHKDFSIIESQLERDKHMKDQLKFYKIQWEERNGQYEKVLLSFEAWEKDAVSHKRKMKDLGEKLCLPPDLALTHLAEAYQLIEKLKKLYREKKYTIEQQESVISQNNVILSAFRHLQSAFLESSPSNLQETAFLLRKRLKEESEKKIKRDEKKTKLIELEDEYEKTSIELNHFKTELENLLALANVESAEPFREIGKKSEIKAELEIELKDVRRQIHMFSFTEKELEEYRNISNTDIVIRQAIEGLDKLKESFPILQKRLAENKYQIQLIEEGGTYAELLHKYKLMKAELEDEAKEWARFAMAKEMLERTIESFKEDRMPKMLERAEEFLAYLTDGNYVRIHPKEKGSGFLIENKHQTVFEANELSQATAEQIYVAFRLALADTVYAKYSFPIIIDDSFVNFDHKRTEKVISLLKTLSGRQILFFTCHKHLLFFFTKEQIIPVSKDMEMPV